jgi:hypothetical protein
MDPVTLAAIVSPYIVKAAEKLGQRLWDKGSEATADEAVSLGRRIVARLTGQEGTRHEAGPEPVGTVGQAVKDVVAIPGDPDAQASLRLAVRKALAADPALLEEITRLVQQQAPRQRTGDRSVNITGGQSGGMNITGDSNTVTTPGNPIREPRDE